MRRFTGYGRGWSEERAKTLIGRILQRLREPATTTEYVWMLIVFSAVVIVLTVLTPAT